MIMIVMTVAVETGPGGDGWSLAGVVFIIAHVVLTHTDGGVILTLTLVAVLEPHVAPGLGVLDVEVVVPAAPVLVVLLLADHPHTQDLVVPAHLLVLHAGGVVILEPVVALVFV